MKSLLNISTLHINSSADLKSIHRSVCVLSLCRAAFISLGRFRIAYVANMENTLFKTWNGQFIFTTSTYFLLLCLFYFPQVNTFTGASSSFKYSDMFISCVVILFCSLFCWSYWCVQAQVTWGQRTWVRYFCSHSERQKTRRTCRGWWTLETPELPHTRASTPSRKCMWTKRVFRAVHTLTLHKYALAGTFSSYSACILWFLGLYTS